MSSEFLGLDRGRVMLDALGSFWTNLFQDKDVLAAYTDGDGEALGQAYFNLLEVVLLKSVFDIPVFHREKWKLLIFKESDLNANSGAFLKYEKQRALYGPQEEGGEFSEGFVFVYGGLIPGVYALTLPEGMIDIESYVTNRIHDPSLVLVKGTNFIIRDGIIFFASNPFENNLIPKRNILNEQGEVTDREIALWALNSDFDFRYLWLNYGSIVEFFLQSSESYKTFLQAIWGLFFLGPRFNRLISASNGLLGLPLIKETTETVAALIEETGGTRIVTDKNSYFVRESAQIKPDILPGKVLNAFDPLTTAINIVDSVTVPRWWNNRKFIPIPTSLLDENFFDSLALIRPSNGTITVDVEFGSTFDAGVIGRMTDTQQEVFENFPLTFGTPGLEFGGPTVEIDPMDMFMENYFSNHIILLEIDVSQILTELIASQFLKILNDALPAYVHFIGIFERPLEDEYDLGELADPVNSPCRGIPQLGNSGDTPLAPANPEVIIADQAFLGGLYDPFNTLTCSWTSSVSGNIVAITGATVANFQLGRQIRLTTAPFDITTIVGINSTGAGAADLYVFPFVTGSIAGVNLQEILVDFEDVYTITITGAPPGTPLLPAAATFDVVTDSGLDGATGVAVGAFGTFNPFGSFGLSASFNDAPAGSAADGFLVTGDSWKFDSRANFLKTYKPGLIDPACIPAVNLSTEDYGPPNLMQDGYWGIPVFGDPISFGDVDPYTGQTLVFGAPYFIPGIRIYLKPSPCI